MGSFLRLQYALVNETPATITPGIITIPVYFALRGCYVLGGLVVLVINYRRLKDINERRRMRVLVAGSIIGWVAIGLFLAFIVAGGGPIVAALSNTPFMPTMLVLYMLFPVSFAYAILRHRVFDLGVIVRQGLQYALARGVLVTAVPLLGLILVADLLLHGQRPLLEILRARGWIYLVLAGLDVVAYVKRQTWLEALDRRFFRERFDAQRLLREVIEEIHKARSFSQVAPLVVARVEATFHPEFAALLVREPREAVYRTLAVAPAEKVVPELPAQSKLMAMVRLFGKPLEVPQTGSSWLGEQLPDEETEFLRKARVEFLVPIAAAPDQAEAVLILGIKRSEEPYSREDRDLLMAISSSLALLVEKPQVAVTPRSDLFEECPQCGTCYDSGAIQCSKEGARLVPVILPRLLEGRYALERRLGRGGMGTVYAALDTALERRIAVKVIREDLVGSAEAAERFRQEGRVAASFAHPNVVTVHDFGLAAGSRAFLVMELQEGATLRETLRRENRLVTPRALAILGDVTAALEAAHRRQLVHRDLKPENIFLSRTELAETAKVLDFGIAKFLSNASQQSTVDTASGAVLGTPRYMSPEQRHGGDAHPSWDVWALSVVAYEVLTGAYPFSKAPHAERIGADGALNFTPLTTHLPGAPHSCQELFERSFARNSADRPPSAQAFLSQLQSSLA